MRFLLFALSLLPVCAFSQSKNILKHELDSMYVLDQRNRVWLTKLGNNQPLTDSLTTLYKVSRTKLAGALWTEQIQIDSSNLKRAEVILQQQGYPGKTMVGVPTNEAIFYIIQHSHKVDTYLPAVKKAAESGELPFHQYALMLDRSLMYAQKPQLYGTQIACRKVRASSASRCFVWPIEDYRNVNQRRKQAGLPLTVAENAVRLNAAYDPSLTMEIARQLYVLDL
ncbi:hypothetical protein EXU85_22220 [Spirosoma sp. KCTC 42546]|uniref:DUF6624 domain-containing protein n=1 Tax=Spirosoma sp. KCTC 42546 TaxID=2520506 RepID=UPI001157A0A5|nr:DUF6624 domain-containing protein [Spirosoma sp. KCTC 42546]QDK81176.1 hypothetical protein EXU85_22220 [Spirosoma sp. KCTC 42546]